VGRTNKSYSPFKIVMMILLIGGFFIALPVGDYLSLCVVYGTKQVAEQHLHVVSSKPVIVVSNGDRWTDGQTTMSTLAGIAIWLLASSLIFGPILWVIEERKLRPGAGGRIDSPDL
jgi:hypothetical protein